jgi:hypothetical protein
MAAPEVWCRAVVVRPDGTVVADRELSGLGGPGLGVVDDVARLALEASRLGARLTLADVSPALSELLDLAGLVVEVEREPELREEAIGVHEGQEEVHPGDLPA